MPIFASGTPPGIYPGDSYALVNNAATDIIVHYTQAIVGVQTTEVAGNQWTLQNTTTQSAVVYVAAKDVPTATYPNGQTANYSALTDADTGVAVAAAAGTTINFTTIGPFICAYFGTAPTSGSLIIAR
jgi:hypothetical protein